MASYAVTKKGQVTIPARFREELGIKPQGRVIFEMEPKRNSVRLYPVRTSIDELYGIFKDKIPPKLRGVSARKLRRMAEEAIAEEVMREMK